MRQWTDHHWFRKWLVAWSPSHYLNQCLTIVNWNLRNKFQWNIKRHSDIVIKGNAFENVVCEMVAILSRPEYVNAWEYWSVLDLHWCIQSDLYIVSSTLLYQHRPSWVDLDLLLWQFNELCCLGVLWLAGFLITCWNSPDFLPYYPCCLDHWIYCLEIQASFGSWQPWRKELDIARH